jgi:FKBP-type peptidyl-prolyl cis-trans isomerase
VSCHYVLTLENGKKIDSSRDRGKAFEFTIGKGEVCIQTIQVSVITVELFFQVIKGWEEGLARVNYVF